VLRLQITAQTATLDVGGQLNERVREGGANSTESVLLEALGLCGCDWSLGSVSLVGQGEQPHD
jgi:hypothetical protein